MKAYCLLVKMRYDVGITNDAIGMVWRSKRSLSKSHTYSNYNGCAFSLSHYTRPHYIPLQCPVSPRHKGNDMELTNGAISAQGDQTRSPLNGFCLNGALTQML